MYTVDTNVAGFCDLTTEGKISNVRASSSKNKNKLKCFRVKNEKINNKLVAQVLS